MKNKKIHILAGVIVGIIVIITSIAIISINSNKDKVIVDKEPTIESPISNEGDKQPGEETKAPEETEEPLVTNEVTLFTADTDTYDKKEIESIEVETSLSLQEQLKIIGETLSNRQFNGLPIEVEKIEEIEGKKIAIINLKEDATGKNEKTWMDYLNAGSTGSTITKVTLEESFLQNGVEAKWIDGMKLIYEGEDIPEMDHFPGTTIVYRKEN